MKEKKTNLNVSSTIVLLEKENSILKQNLNSYKSKKSNKPVLPELITGILIWCLGVIAYKKMVTAK